MKITKTEIDLSLSLAEVKVLVKLFGGMTHSQYEAILRKDESSLVLGIYSLLADELEIEKEEP